MKKVKKETRKKVNGNGGGIKLRRKLLNKHGLDGADGVLKAFLLSLPEKFGWSKKLAVTFHYETHSKKSILDLYEACLGSGDPNNVFRKARVALSRDEKTDKFYAIAEISLEKFGWRHLRRGNDALIYFKNLRSLKRFLNNGADDLLKEFYGGKAQASPNNKKIRNKIVFANN